MGFLSLDPDLVSLIFKNVRGNLLNSAFRLVNFFSQGFSVIGFRFNSQTVEFVIIDIPRGPFYRGQFDYYSHLYHFLNITLFLNLIIFLKQLLVLLLSFRKI